MTNNKTIHIKNQSQFANIRIFYRIHTAICKHLALEMIRK